MKTGRFDESIAQYQKALSVDPHFSNAFIGIATDLMLQGKHDQAAAQAQKLYDKARDDGDKRFALFARSVIFADAGRPAEAIKEIDKEYRLDAELADTANMSGDALLIGNILLNAGKPDEAAKKFRQATDLIEKSSLSADVKSDNQLADHYNKGRVSLAKGRCRRREEGIGGLHQRRGEPQQQLPHPPGARAGRDDRPPGEELRHRDLRVRPGQPAEPAGGLLRGAGVSW